MAAYKDLVGQKITKVTSNPGEPKTGQMWYNSTTGTLKGLGLVEAWSSTTAMGTSRYGHGAAGNKGGGIVASGRPPASGPAAMVTAEEYDGGGWRATSNINTGRFFAGNSFGTETASVFAGGFSPSAPNMVLTELYDGSSFSESGDLSESKYAAINAGTTTAGLLAGGSPGRTSTEEFGGSSWTSGNATNTALEDRCGLGTQTAAIGMGGAAPPGTPFATTETEFYDGTSWTIGASLNNSRRRGSGGGTQTAGLVYGGLVPGPAASNKSEFYDGTSWTNNANMGTSRYYGYGNSSGGTFAVGDIYVAGGLTSPGAPNHTTAAEEYNRSTNTVTAAAWASTPSLGTARRQVGGFGHTTTTAVCVCGQNPPALSNVEEYDGSSWSEVNNMPVARVKPFASGTLTAGLAGGGESGPTPTSAPSAAEYDGTNWTATPAIPQAATDSTSFGLQTATVMCVGSPSPTTAVFDYDGSTWTAGNATPIQMASSSGNGIETAGLVYTGSAFSTSQSLAYNGSSWTSAGTLIAGRSRAAEAVGAPSTAALFFGGDNPAPTQHANTYGYDGTSWYTRPNMATARRGLGGAGIKTAAIAFAGYTGSDTAASEEFTGETSAANIADFTTS